MIDDLVHQIEARFRELEDDLADPAVIGDRERFTAASRAYRELEPAAKLAGEYRRAADDAAGARELLDEGEDAELRELLRSATERLEALEDEIRLAMVERDPNDDKNVIIEIRPGAGGDEAGLWAGDLYRMLTRYAERRGFKTEALSIGEGTYTFAVKGDGAYSVFKFEGGRIVSSACPRPSRRGGSTPPRRLWPCFPRSTTSRWRSIPVTCRSTSTGAPVPGGSPSTRPTRPCG
jgi:peptide chain release factor 1